MGYGADEGTGVLRNWLVAVEDSFEWDIGAVLGTGVVGVLREDGAREVETGEEPLAARVGKELGAHGRVCCGLRVAPDPPGDAAASAPSLNLLFSMSCRPRWFMATRMRSVVWPPICHPSCRPQA